MRIVIAIDDLHPYQNAIAHKPAERPLPIHNSTGGAMVCGAALAFRNAVATETPPQRPLACPHR
ncbi:MAG: hypothetical protein L6Q57_07795 [Alphaproteobacteria bacterium]|nr:hypothetical protein [Alphaproteobacteria bacterium]